MSLYQSVRPKQWDDIVGNDRVVGALRGLVKRKPEDRPHAIMLKGPRGCGKTTMARILAREFGANSDNILEYNAANTRGIDTVRDVIAGMQLSAFGGGAKCYIFDESHQLTSAAQEAFLKDAEEPPAHCYIFFCTTNAENIISALRNRFAEYEVDPLSTKNILTVLAKACEAKGLKVSTDILEVISCNSEGIPRTALVLLEKIMDIEDEEAALDLLVSEIDSDNSVFDMCKMLLRKPELRRKSWKKILHIFNSIKETDSEKIRRASLGFFLYQLKNLPEEAVEYAEDIVRMMEVFSTNTFYGKKKQLSCLILKACFMDKENKNAGTK